jgi:alpha-tubulin suppressor-like RCC1 family protein
VDSYTAVATGGYGQLGPPDNQDHYLPISLKLPEPIFKLAIGAYSTLAHTSDGRVYALGVRTKNPGEEIARSIGGHTVILPFPQGIKDAVAGCFNHLLLTKDEELFGFNENRYVGRLSLRRR